MATPIPVPQEIQSRLADVGLNARTAPRERIVEECRYVIQLLDEGGSTYDEDPPAERQRLRTACLKYIAE